MNESSRQTQDTAMAWADAQRKMWEYWMRTAEPVVRPPYVEAWQRSASTMIDAWENAVKLGLQAQLNWAGFFTRSVTENERAPKEIVEWAHQSYDTAKAWNEAQRELWAVPFAWLRSSGPTMYASGFLEISKAWQEAARKTLDAQADVAKRSMEEGSRVAETAAQQAGRTAETASQQAGRTAETATQQAERAAKPPQQQQIDRTGAPGRG